MERVFGNYTLVERIGVGGMGEVYRAIKGGPDGFKVEVALKLILPHLARDESFRERFFDEAFRAAGLNHPNIVRIQGYDSLDGTPFIEMEYVAGTDLAALIKSLDDGERLPFSEAAYIIHGTARGLACAHTRPQDGDGRGPSIHRDLNPHNILLSRAGEVKIADFGIARASQVEATVSATLRGKLSYMAPEQVDGKPLDHRCDLFSLGITAYQLFTGVHPFKRASEAATLIAVQKASFRPLTEVAPELPEKIRETIESLLSASPEERPDSAGFVADTMEELIEPGASTAVGRRVEEISSSEAAPVSSAATASATALTMHKRKDLKNPLLATIVLAAGVAIVISVFLATKGSGLKPESSPSISTNKSPPATNQIPLMETPIPDSVFTVISDPSGAVIFADGIRLGVTPVEVTAGPEGQMPVLEARLYGHETKTFKITHDSDGRYMIRLQPVAMATVTVSIRPWGTISEGGKMIGENHREFKLPVGRHNLTLANNALGLERIVTVNVREGGNLFQFDLEE